MGEELQGKWLDKRTGKCIFVDDMIMDGDTMLVKTSIGMLDGNTFGQYFIKMSEEDYGTTGVSPEISNDSINDAINAGIDNDLRVSQVEVKHEPIVKSHTESNKSNSKKSNADGAQNIGTQNVNYLLIDKVFKKMKTQPAMEITTNISDWPIKELQMLINVFEVSIDEISDYIVTTQLSKDILINFFNDYFRKELES